NISEKPTSSIPLLMRMVPDGNVNYFSKQSKFDVDVWCMFAACDNVIHVEGEGGKAYDIDTIKPLARSLHADGVNLNILHFIGSHFPAFRNFPGEYSQWGIAENSSLNSAGSFLGNIKRRTTNADKLDQYDNSLYYTDFVIESVVRLCETKEYPIWIMYVSDHGESPGGTIRNPHEKSTWEIPLCFWFNKSFREKYPDVVQAVMANVDRPVQTDCVYEIICWLMGVSYDGFPRHRVPFDPSYRSPVRMMGDKVYVK
ncbi:MAG: sulfatase-like hydrolase/transferase, partial [Victivallaceae bacterium]|nr:sulfatase-like hydrolase/transferase [Victivallaceae bacterium]